MSPDFLPHTDSLIHASTLDLEHEPVPSSQLVAGTPMTATAVLGESGGLELGVWEMTPGTMTDVEADELCVVLSGTAAVEIAATDEQPATVLQLSAGDVVRLRAGMQTRWTVDVTFRKVYLAAP